jgi:transketolase
MLNPFQKLNYNIFNRDVELIPIRKGFGEGLVIAGDMNKNVVGLCSDLTESTVMNLFKNKYPERFIEMGIAEQNMSGVASGMAASGKIPFITSYAMFSPGRNWEQIRTTICYNDRNVKIVGSHAGVSVGPDGGTHQALEDIALMRVIPNIVVISPCDAIEARKATIAMAQTKVPTYIRLARNPTPVITTKDSPFEIGKAQFLFEPKVKNGKEVRSEIGIIATGALVHKALVVANDLEKEGIKVKVLNLSTIKPLDEDTVWRLAHEAGAIVTVEEHQIAGGMGSAVAECLARHYPVPMEFVGVKDKFGQSGTPEELLKHYEMAEMDIKEAVKRVMMRKGK